MRNVCRFRGRWFHAGTPRKESHPRCYTVSRLLLLLLLLLCWCSREPFEEILGTLSHVMKAEIAKESWPTFCILFLTISRLVPFFAPMSILGDNYWWQRNSGWLTVVHGIEDHYVEGVSLSLRPEASATNIHSGIGRRLRSKAGESFTPQRD